MKVSARFGFFDVTFEGSARAVNTFAAVKSSLSKRGCGIELPAIGESIEPTVPGVGSIRITRLDVKNCAVVHLHGRLVSWLIYHFLD